jgi:hypothetical protein
MEDTMISVRDEDVGHGQNVTCTVDGVQVKVHECANTGDIIVDVYMGEMPVLTMYKGQYLRKIATFKHSCDANNIDRETM